jgi:hypothetical protein
MDAVQVALIALAGAGQRPPETRRVIRPLLQHVRQTIREAAVECLAAMGEDSATLVSTIADLIRRGDQPTRHATLRWLGERGEEYSSLVGALEDPSVMQDEAAAPEALLALSSVARSMPGVRVFLIERLRSSNPYVQCNAARGLAAIGTPVPDDVLGTLARCLASPSTEYAALIGLRTLGTASRPVEDSLRTCMVESGYETVRLAACEALLAIGAWDATIEFAMSDVAELEGPPDIRRRAVRVLPAGRALGRRTLLILSWLSVAAPDADLRREAGEFLERFAHKGGMVPR